MRLIYIKRVVKKLKVISNKVLIVFMAISLGVISIWGPNIINVFAADQVINLANGTINGNSIEYYDGETLMGTAVVKIGDETLSPADGMIILPTFVEPYQVSFHFTIESGFEVLSFNVNGEGTGPMPGDNIKNITINSADNISIGIVFAALPSGPSGPDGPSDGPMPETFPILAYFSGIDNPVEGDDLNDITIPSSWNSGSVTFKAKGCTVDNVFVPDNGVYVCEEGTQELKDLHIEGLMGNQDINNTVVSSEDRMTLTVTDDFFNYGRIGLHLIGERVNTSGNLNAEDLINVIADAPLRMEFSLGSTMSKEAIVTNNEAGDVIVFFGNTETTLTAMGPQVKGIKSVSKGEAVINEDGSATFNLPNLSVETTTPVEIEIEMIDGTTVKRNINIIRTAIELSYYPEENQIKAGYVMHKAYLYNNENHNSDAFDAYLQIMFYKGDTVVGFKQIQIDDEELVNSLAEDESGAFESFAPNGIILFDDEIEGVTKASVFLTNGPINFNNNKLPSVEFGIGAGVMIDFGDRI